MAGKSVTIRPFLTPECFLETEVEVGVSGTQEIRKGIRVHEFLISRFNSGRVE
jgi:hypothetical protein